MKKARTISTFKNYLSATLIIALTLISSFVHFEISAKGNPTLYELNELDKDEFDCSSTPPGIFLEGSSRLQCLDISGQVFEDINYGGGDGRAYNIANASATSSGWASDDIGLNNVRIELYDNGGAFISSTTTDAIGQYTFFCAVAGSYFVRVVNQTISSNRGSNSTGQTVIPSQTYRHTGSVAVVNEVGGFNPMFIDAGPNTTSSALSTLYTGSTTVQSLSSIMVGSDPVVGVDFGFNFDVIVNTNDTGQGSLRQFILNSNELDNVNLDQEDNPASGQNFTKPAETEHSIFMIPGTGVHTIIPISGLPTITDDFTHLTGYTQNGSAQGTISGRINTIELTGATVLFDGLHLRADHITISGLVINEFRFGITGTTASSNQFIWGNYIGTSPDGLSGKGNSNAGVRLQNITSSFIGTNGDNFNDANEGNLVSDNYEGINLRSASGVAVSGNVIGLNSTGNADLGNSFNGIYVRDATGVNVIGFDDNATSNTPLHFRNVSSGNGNDGIRLVSSSDQIIAGNYFGTDVTGTIALGNRNYGVQISGASSDNIVGTDSDGDDDVLETNVISGNGTGLRFLVTGTGTNNRIAGNFVGVDVTGNVALGNLNNGIEVNSDYSGTIIGTNGDNINDAVERNIISGNDDDGIRLASTNDNIIAGNYIGLGVDGTTAIPNGKRGVFITLTSSNNVVGYSPSMANSNELIVGNFIKYNGDSGIGQSGTGTQNRYSRNQLENNGALGIDLGYNSVTSNDDGDGDTGANDLLNFPVLTSVSLSNNGLTIIGFAPAGANLEFFLADSIPSPNPLPGGYTASFGEGRLYLFEATEGSAADTNGNIGTYDNDGTGVITVRTQSMFQFTFDVTGIVFKQGMNTSLEVGMFISSTATDTNNSTSEFSNITEILPGGIKATDDFNNTPINTPVGSNVLTNDEDGPGDSLSVTMVTTVPAAEGTVVLSPDGNYVYTPAPGFSGETSFVYEVCDDITPPSCEEATVYLEVLPAVDPEITSVIANPDQGATEQGEPLFNTLFNNDYDPEGTSYMVTNILADTDGDGIANDVVPVGTATPVYGVDEEGNVKIAGTLQVDANGDYTFVPDPAFTGEVPVEYEITDEEGDMDATFLTINVVSAEENNTFATDDAGFTDVNIPIDGAVMANDFDPEGDICSVNTVLVDADGDGIADDPAVVGTPSSVFGYDATGALVPAGTLVINLDGTYTYTPAPEFVGNVVAVYTVCDGGTPEACDEATLDLTVIGSYRDYGDAPAAYPIAWHTHLTDSDGDNKLDATTAVWLGTYTGFESQSKTSASATGDEYDDAMSFGSNPGQFPIDVAIGTTYNVTVTLNGNQTGDNVFLGMWIDWNADGIFDDFHTVTGVTNSPVDVSVGITPPTNYVDGTAVVVRLRVDDEELMETDFEGSLSNGETEDYLYDVTLPVELASFSALEKDCKTVINWETGLELNTSHFEVQASRNQLDFYSIGIVQAKGATIEPQSYQFVHDTDHKTTYYRLKSVDFDGKFAFSDVVVVKSTCVSFEDGFLLFPNPTDGVLTISFESPITVDGQLEVVDAIGRIIQSYDLVLTTGFNQVELQTSRLAPGIYYINLAFGAYEIRTQKFVKISE